MRRTVFTFLFSFLVILSSKSAVIPAFSDSVFNKFNIQPNDSLKSLVLNDAAWFFYKKNEFDKSVYYADTALKFCQRVSFKPGQARAYNILGLTAWNKGDFILALKQLNLSLQIKKELGDKKAIASAMNNIGIVYRSQGNYARALEIFLQTLEVREKLKNPKDIAASLNNIGLIYDDLGELDKAYKYYTRSLAYSIEMDDKDEIANQYNNLAILLRKKGDLSKALEFQNKTLTYQLSTGDRQQIARSYANIGVIYQYMNDLTLALDYDQRSLKINEELGDQTAIVLALHNIAEVYFKRKEYKNAIANATRGLSIANTIDSKVDIKELNYLLSNIYDELHDAQKAYPYYREFVKTRDSLYSKEKTSEIVRSEMNFEYEKQKELERIGQEKKDAISESEHRKQQLVIYFGAGILLLVMIFAVILFRSYKAKQKANDRLAEINVVIEEKNKSITDSITYANRIQQAIFPAKGIKFKFFPNSFVFLQPRDIVSGDFYWFAEKNGKRFIAAVDCTGHGVPGAFMSMIGNSLLNQIVMEKGIGSPEEILNELNSGIIVSLKQYETDTHDGMDIALLCFEGDQVIYAGANRPLIKVSDGKAYEYKANKNSIGGMQGLEDKKFTEQKIEVKKNDMLYIFSDGFADQFGGPKGKKFKSKKMVELFERIHDKRPDAQEAILLKTINEWKNKLEQVDDILVIGINV